MPHNKKLRVLYIHHDGAISGSAISLCYMLSGLNRKLINPRVLLANEGPARQLYEALNIPVDVIPIRRYYAIPGAPWIERSYHRNWLALMPNPSLREYLLNMQPDLVHINDQPMIQAGLVAHNLRLPIIWHLRGAYYASKSRLQASISRWIIRKTSYRQIAISQDEAVGFEDLKRVHVIYNSLDFDKVNNAIPKRDSIRTELGIKPHEVAVGMVGQLNKNKGAWDLIQAGGLAKSNCQDVPFRFIIVARIPNREPRALGIRERIGLVDHTHPEDNAWLLANRAGITENLILTDYREDSLEVISAFDILVSYNRLAAISRPAFEAMAIGRPVITNVGHSGRSEIVVDGETAIVIPPADPHALARAIVRLAKYPDLRKQMGKKGYDYARTHFDPWNNTQLIQKIYDEVMDSC